MGSIKDLELGGNSVAVYEARPEGEIKGGLIVIHEVWGLDDHVKDVADRFAAQGYLAWAPDLLSGAIDIKAIAPLKLDLFNPEKRTEAQPKIRALTAPMQNPEFGKKTTETIKQLFSKLYDTPEVNQKVAVIGFCFGGSYSFSLAVNEPRLKLALPFYGHADFSVDELKQIKCPIRAFYGQNDEGLISSLDQLKENMNKAGVDFEAKVYEGCGHAFFNDTNPYSYNETAAKDSWVIVNEYLTKFLI